MERAQSPMLAQLTVWAILIGSCASVAVAGTWVPVGENRSGSAAGLDSPRAPHVVVDRPGDYGLNVLIELTGLEFTPGEGNRNGFVTAGWPESPTGGNAGEPSLPVVRRLFITPQGADVSFDADEGPKTVLELHAVGIHKALAPVQGPDRSAVDPNRERPLQFDATAYEAGGFAPGQRVAITSVGIVRGWELHLLEVRPAAYNPVSHELAVWPEIRVAIRFTGGTQRAGGLGSMESINGAVLNPRPSTRGGAQTGNYLIIAAEVFGGSAPLAQFEAAKTAQGFSTTTYIVPVGTSRDDIRNYILSLWSGPDAPDYILIIGDANERTATAESHTVPAWAGVTYNLPVSDLYYACMDAGDDWMPDIAIGRWPMATVGDLQAIVDKTLHVEAGVFSDPGYAERAIFIAGTDENANAEALHDWMIDSYMEPRNLESERLYMTSYGADTQDVSDAFNQGASLAAFFGHSGFQFWAGPYFKLDDVNNLTNEGHYPFIASFSCSAAAFWRTNYEPNFLEQWLRAPSKGAVACYGPTKALLPNTWLEWDMLYRCLFTSIFDNGNRELGAAYQGALALFVAHYGTGVAVSREYAESFVLLGDPSLRLVDPPENVYLIVVPEGFASALSLAQLVSAKEAQGFNVITHSVSTGTSRADIKAYIQSLWGTANEPDYVLLIGDTAGSTSTATTIPHWVGGGSRNAATDLPYVCMDAGDDWYPEMPIGRMSVSSTAELAAVVEKTLYVEAGNFADPDYAKRAAFLATDDSTAQAEQTHDWVIDQYLTPNGFKPIKIYANQGGGTEDVANAVNSGCLFTTYMGHSSQSGWWTPSFDQTDVNSLTNVNCYGLVMGWSCNSAHFDDPECFGETWIRKMDAGAAAYLSASDYVWWGSVEDWDSSRRMEKYFYQSMFEKSNWRVGPAWQEACFQLLEDPDYGPTHDHTRNIFEEFVLLGDPALRLPNPVGISLGATPDSLSLCCPPDDEALFNVNIGQTGGFPHEVTLQASGAPAGATVEFSANTRQAPLLSVLTIGNLAGAADGTYDIQITASATGQWEQVNVRLDVSNSSPVDPTLLSPPNGEIEVSRAPTLAWNAIAQAAEYDLELATDSNFTTIIYSATVSQTDHEVDMQLGSLTEYFWRVRAVNGCGNSGFSAPFSFTTLEFSDYFTEQFAGGSDAPDLAYTTVSFTPNGTANFYTACAQPAASLPTDPSGGTVLSIGEDSWATVVYAPNVHLYGVSYNTFYVCDNGSITFAQGDSTWQESLSNYFAQPRIAPLNDDFTVAGGTVSWRSLPDRAVVTYEDVPEYGTGNSNTFQIEMFQDGRIDITWLDLEAEDGIVGFSQGNGTPADFQETNLSGATPCQSLGACCLGSDTCAVLSPVACTTSGGQYQGDGIGCEPNPCVQYESGCIIISEVVDGCLSGGCPRWIELTNTSTSDFVFLEGGVIVQMDGSSDFVVDVDLTGKTIPAGASYVIDSAYQGICTGAFSITYGFDADLSTLAALGDGNDRYMLTDTADGSNILDIYGEHADPTGLWDYADGYSYRRSLYSAGRGLDFAPYEWFFGGVGSLDQGSPEYHLQDYTSPGVHTYTHDCADGWVPGDCDGDGDTDLVDYACFFDCLAGPGAAPDPQSATKLQCLEAHDLDADGDVDMQDFCTFQAVCEGG